MIEFKKITAVTGHFGAGKTNTAVNIALDLAKRNKSVTIVDLDIVNPYFRTADLTEFLKSRNIEVVAPLFANTNLDIPAVNFDLERIVSGLDYVIIDAGGDDSGAAALGRYAEALSRGDFDMFYVINYYRYLTRSPDEAVCLMRDIENASRLSVTGIINNSNLGSETTPDDIKKSFAYAGEIAEKANLPIVFTTCGRGMNLESCVPVGIYVRTVWDS